MTVRYRNRVVIDRDYFILAARTESGLLERSVGKCLWDVLPPGVAQCYLRVYREAWERGEARDVCFCHGRLFKSEVRRSGDVLVVRYNVLVELDVSTFETLGESLSRIFSLLCVLREDEESRRVSRPGLRLVAPTPGDDPQVPDRAEAQ